MNTSDLYHEKQKLQHCLIHTLNNILQKKEFNVEKVNEICYSYDSSRWFNAHKSWIGLGNYDANILMGALQLHDMKVIWFDKRTPVSNIQFLAVNAIVFNIPCRTYIPFMNGRHWFAVLQKDGKFYNLDSKLDAPEIVENVSEYTENYLKSQNVEIMFVIAADTPEEEVVKK
ncbi:unnamed protein product [Caenorhabditis angaria]|uniref:ubiquitinyl hydrolase 1 n=1 Tax=Caenorhabditis angaria TaxID=860376 RepID=A0A9P1NB47_9PELO|nr:unnamed protein product [Caenorhabditis angaria]